MIKKCVLACVVFLQFFVISELALAKEVVSETDYQLPLKEAVRIQVEATAVPISSDYAADPAYVLAGDVKFIRPMLKHVKTFLRTAPSVTSPVALTFVAGVPFEIVDVVEGAGGLGDDLWYEVLYERELYYMKADDVLIINAIVKHDTAALAGRNVHQHAFGDFVQGSEVTVRGVYPNWIATDYNRWRVPKSEDVEVSMDPQFANGLQHLRLDSLAGVTGVELDSVLTGKGTLGGEGASFVRGAEEYGVNEAYLIAHAFLETGHGTSELAMGTEVGLSVEGEPVVVTDRNRAALTEIKTVYNMFGIGAADSCPLECGAATAYENDWITPGDAIYGGAEWIRSGYIYNDYDQNTLYKMKWNPRMYEGHEWKQYATDIDWAEKQTGLIGDIYDQLVDPDYHYDYPKYRE